ncbi:MAG: 23S rRNA (uridine(2552)-2'-O)-methyltransferase RlmE [Granulosicoccaceae bacterium]
MARSKSSAGWLKEHFDDEFVARSQKDGYRSRAVYKLIEMDERDQLFKLGQRVVELGSAPGGWTQYLSDKLGDNGTIVASDILPMDGFAGVEFVLGDFTEQAVFDQIMSALNGELADAVISDMAPNVTGQASIDQPRSMYLVELAVDMALQILKPDGLLLMKVFQGEGFEELMRELRTHFKSVKTRKPKASRDRSRELYVMARHRILV